MPPPVEIPDFLSQEIARLGGRVIPVTPPHVFRLLDLPAIHQDPLDRLLIAQAIVEEALIVTGDEQIHRYGAPTLW